MRSGHGRPKESAAYKQRCAVRVTYSPNKTVGQWKAHGHYLARESATEKIKLHAAGDQRLFKLIVSPEFGDRLDLKAHARELLHRMERDLNSKLEWAAVIHYNTDHPHVQIAMRGRDEKGQPLRLPREYVRSGIRAHTEDIATKELVSGPREML